MTGCQLRPTDRAMAARSVRTSSSEEKSRSTDEDERMLTKPCIEDHNVCRVLTAVTQGSPRPDSTDHGAETMGSGTRTTDSRVSVATSPFSSASPSRRIVAIVAVTVATQFSFTWASGAWSVLRSSSSAFRRGRQDQWACRPSASSEYQRSPQSEVHDRRDSAAAAL